MNHSGTLDLHKRCLIISGGDYADIEASPDTFDLIIACDKGYLNAQKAGISPHILIGDFDSLGTEGPSPCPEDCSDTTTGSDPDSSFDHRPEIIRLPVMKDDTDTMSAVKYALDAGCDEITVSCAFGGRFDHSMANIQTAAYIAERGAKPEICGKDTYAYAVKNGSIVLKKREGFTLSVFSLSNECRNVSIRGTLYLLDQAVLKNTFPLGVSNSWTEDQATITVEDGILIVITSKDN